MTSLPVQGLLALKRGLDRLSDGIAILAGLGVVMLMIHVNAEVISRALRYPLVGTIVFVCNYYMAFLVCLPLAYVERINGHISVELVTQTLPAWIQRHLKAWTWLLSAVVTFFVAWASWIEAVSKFKLKTFAMENDMAIPIWPGYFAVPMGYGLLSLYLLVKFVLYLFGDKEAIEHPAQTATERSTEVEHFHD